MGHRDTDAQPTEPGAQDELGVVLELQLRVADVNLTLRQLVARFCDRHEAHTAHARKTA